MKDKLTTTIRRKTISFTIPDLVIEEKIIRKIIFPKKRKKKK